jgi:hypothetical protein
MKQISVFQHLKGIGGAFGLQNKPFLALDILDCHFTDSFLRSLLKAIHYTIQQSI